MLPRPSKGSRLVSLAATLILATSAVLTGVPAGLQTAHAADPCDGVIDDNAFSQGCAGMVPAPGIPRTGRPPGSSDCPPISFGRFPWTMPRDVNSPTDYPVRPDSLVTELTAPGRGIYGNSYASDHFDATVEQISNSVYRALYKKGSDFSYGNSFYWHDLEESLVATSLFIDFSDFRRDPFFHIQGDTARMERTNKSWLISSRSSDDKSAFTFERFFFRPEKTYYGSLSLNPTWSTYAWMWSPSGTETQSIGQPSKTGQQLPVPSSSAVQNAVANYIGSKIEPGSAPNPSYWDDWFVRRLWVDNNGFNSKMIRPFVKDAVSASYVSGHPYEVWLSVPPPQPAKRSDGVVPKPVNGFYFWTKQQLTGAQVPAGTKLTVRVVIPNRQTGLEGRYDTLQKLSALFERMIQDQLDTKWNETGAFVSDLGGAWAAGRGRYVLFIFEFWGDNREHSVPAGCSGLGDSYVLWQPPYGPKFPVERSKQTSPNDCNMAAVRSNADYRVRVKNPIVCGMFVHVFQVPPPKIDATSWELAAQGAFSPVGYRAGNACQDAAGRAVPCSVTVGQNFTVPIPPHCTAQALNKSADVELAGDKFNKKYASDFTLRQTGVTFEIGGTVYGRVSRTKSDCSQYGLVLGHFTQTALSRAQQPVDPDRPYSSISNPVCLSLTPTAMALRCGVVIALRDAAKPFNAQANPYVFKYRLSVHTWWDGMYHLKLNGAYLPYRGLFSPQWAAIPAKYLAGGADRRVWQWGPAANYKTLGALAFEPARWPLSTPGYSRSGWPSFGATSPDAYGSPLWDASAGQGGAVYTPIAGGYVPYIDVYVTQVQPTSGSR